MKVTNAEILEAQGAMEKLIELDCWPVRISLDMALVSNMIDEQVKAYHLVVKKYQKSLAIKGTLSEDGKSIKFECTAKGESEEETQKLKTENMQTFMEKLGELLDARTDDMIFKKVSLPKQFNGKDISVKGSILKALTEFVEVA